MGRAEKKKDEKEGKHVSKKYTGDKRKKRGDTRSTEKREKGCV